MYLHLPVRWPAWKQARYAAPTGQAGRGGMTGAG